MTQIDQKLLFTKEHEWILIESNIGTIGITEYAQHALGDIVFVEMPELGDDIDASDEFGTIESVKTVSSLYMPVSGKITELNEELEGAPELINSDPSGEGWIVKIELTESGDTESLMNADEYDQYLKELD